MNSKINAIAVSGTRIEVARNAAAPITANAPDGAGPPRRPDTAQHDGEQCAVAQAGRQQSACRAGAQTRPRYQHAQHEQNGGELQRERAVESHLRRSLAVTQQQRELDGEQPDAEKVDRAQQHQPVIARRAGACMVGEPRELPGREANKRPGQRRPHDQRSGARIVRHVVLRKVAETGSRDEPRDRRGDDGRHERSPTDTEDQSFQHVHRTCKRHVIDRGKARAGATRDHDSGFIHRESGERRQSAGQHRADFARRDFPPQRRAKRDGDNLQQCVADGCDSRHARVVAVHRSCDAHERSAPAIDRPPADTCDQPAEREHFHSP